MNRRWIDVGLCVAVVVLVFSGAVGTTAAKGKGGGGTTATWTFALYVNGDNSLAKYWAEDSLPFLQGVPASTQVNIVALVSLKNATNDYVEKISGTSVTIVQTLPKEDMGIPSTLTWWISTSTTLFPSTYYALDIWDHGYGWRYVSSDDLSGHRLSMPQLQDAIEAADTPIAVLGFDACNMGNEEVVYQLAQTNLVSYVVGSEESVPYIGFPYDEMLTPLAANPSMTPRDLSAAMVDGWGAYYGGLAWANTVNLAAYDVATVKSSVGTFTAWTGQMMRLLPAYAKAYATSLKHAYAAAGTHFYVDAVDYATQLLAAKGVTDAAFRVATQTLASSASTTVVRVWNGAKMSMCGGITFYFGTGTDWSSSSAAYLQTAFAVDTGWGGFLASYNA